MCKCSKSLLKNRVRCNKTDDRFNKLLSRRYTAKTLINALADIFAGFKYKCT